MKLFNNSRLFFVSIAGLLFVGIISGAWAMRGPNTTLTNLKGIMSRPLQLNEQQNGNNNGQQSELQPVEPSTKSPDQPESAQQTDNNQDVNTKFPDKSASAHSTDPPPFKVAQEISIFDTELSSPSVTIYVGETVRWTNFGTGHTVTSDTGAFDSGQMDNGESYYHTFNTAGTYGYFSGTNPEITGMVIVEDAF